MNKYAPIVVDLQEAYAAQGGTGVTWKATDIAVRADKKAGTAVWFVKAIAVSRILDADALETLVNDDLLTNNGDYEIVTLGKTRAKALGVRMTELQAKAREAERDQGQVLVLNRKTKSLERELKLAREHSAADHAMADVISSFAQMLGKSTLVRRTPVKFSRLKARSKALGGTPTLFLSDLHYAERVDPAQVEYLNVYDVDIARRRLARVFAKSQELLLRHMGGMTYEALVLALGGDMLSGNIHDELRESNAMPIAEAVLDLAQHLDRGIGELAENFPALLVPCVVGNHGRLDKKPRAKNKVKDSFDWLLYKVLEMVAAKYSNVEFLVSEAADVRFDIYDIRFNLTHGDQFSSAGGVGGIFPGLLKTDYRKRKRSMQTGRGGYDYLMMGHWHQYGTQEGIIVNGSLKGMDEYAYLGNFTYEPPIQALWVTHPEHGITQHLPVYADDPVKKDNSPPPIRTYRKDELQAA